MIIQFSNNDDFEKEVSSFRKIDLEIIKKIEPKWAYGENSDKIYDYVLHPESDKYIIAIVKVKDLLENIEFLDFDLENLFIDDLASDYRVMSTLKRWQKNKYVDPPILSFSTSNEKKLCLADGRHRFKISYFLKLEKIPIGINKYNLESICKIIDIEFT